MQYCFGLAALVSSCSTDDGPTPLPPVFPPSATEVLVLNEGIFQRGNASITAYDPESGSAADAGFALAEPSALDVLQSAVRLDDNRIVLVSNNTNALIVVDAAERTELRRFAGLGSPRYAVPTDDGQLLSTELYTPRALLTDLADGTKREISLSYPAEQVARVGDAYVLASPNSEYLYWLTGAPLRLTDSIRVGRRIAVLAKADDDVLYAASGVVENDHSGGLYRVDLATSRVDLLRSFPFDSSSYYPRVVTDGEVVYCLQAGLWAVSVAEGSEAIVRSIDLPADRIYYGLGLDRTGGRVYVGDANDFSGAGEVLVIEADGTPVDTFRAGFLPNGFVFP